MPLKLFVIPPEADGMKVALLLRHLLPDTQESVFRKLFSSRDVKLDGVRVGRDTPVRAGQSLCVYLPDRTDSEDLLRVVYEDEDILLVNKPAGISVESDAPGQLSLTDLCRMHTEKNNPSAFAPSPCHRLDNKTCGLCLFAKNSASLTVLLEAFRSRSLEKYYTCLVRGFMKPPSAVCEGFLLKDAEKAKVRIFDHPVQGARPIMTGYETLSAGAVSRLRVRLFTGRTHQIRAHLAALGHPVLGDDLYGDREFNHQQKARSLKLCATRLVLNVPDLPALNGRAFEIDPPF